MVAVMVARDAAVAARKPIADTVLDDTIRTWKRVRLSKGHELGWPPDSLLGRIVDMGLQAIAALRARIKGSTAPVTFLPVDMDAIYVQRIVDEMPYPLQSAFVAYHLGIVRGDVCRERSHKYRAELLAIHEREYYRRKDSAREYIRTRMTLDMCQ